MHSFCSIVRWDKAYDFSCFTDYCTRVRQKFGLGLPSNATTVALLPYLHCDPLHRGHLVMPRSVRPSVCPSVGTLKMRDIKLRDMKMRHHVAGVENARHESAAPECKGGNARHENAAPCCRGGKCETWSCGTRLQGWKMRDMKMRETR